MDGGIETVEDADAAQASRKLANRIHRNALVVGVLVAIITYGAARFGA